MKTILCFLVVAALVAQICARPGDKDEKKPAGDAKKVAHIAKDEAKKGTDKAEDTAKEAKKKLEKGADDAKDDVEKGADGYEDEAKKVVPHGPKKHHSRGLFQGMARMGEGVIDSWSGMADGILGF